MNALLSQKKNRLIEWPINIRHIPYKTFIIYYLISCLFDVYMDCCSLSVTGPQTSTSQTILIKRYSKHYRHRHNVKSPYECFMDQKWQNGVHGYWNNKVFYCHWPSTSDIKTKVPRENILCFGNCPTTYRITDFSLNKILLTFEVYNYDYSTQCSLTQSLTEVCTLKWLFITNVGCFVVDKN